MFEVCLRSRVITGRFAGRCLSCFAFGVIFDYVAEHTSDEPTVDNIRVWPLQPAPPAPPEPALERP